MKLTQNNHIEPHKNEGSIRPRNFKWKTQSSHSLLNWYAYKPSCKTTYSCILLQEKLTYFALYSCFSVGENADPEDEENLEFLLIQQDIIYVTPHPTPAKMYGVFYQRVPEGWRAWHVNTHHITVFIQSMSLTLLKLRQPRGNQWLIHPLHSSCQWSKFCQKIVPPMSVIPHIPLQQTRCIWKVASWSGQCLCCKWELCLPFLCWSNSSSSRFSDMEQVTLFTQYERRVVKGIFFYSI